MKYTVVIQYAESDTSVEWVEAENSNMAGLMVMNSDAEIIAIFEGHHQELHCHSGEIVEVWQFKIGGQGEVSRVDEFRAVVEHRTVIMPVSKGLCCSPIIKEDVYPSVEYKGVTYQPRFDARINRWKIILPGKVQV